MKSIQWLKGKILKSITLKKFDLVEKIYQNLYKKCFNLTKERQRRKCDGL